MPGSTLALDPPQLSSLAEAPTGCDLHIRQLEGPSCDQLRQLGFCESLRVRKLANGRLMLCSLCGTRLALSRDLARQVMVQNHPHQPPLPTGRK